ncbi:helix-turn-helix domain-containing protein [Streptomyces mobaraensis]|uniref:Helix-turn-helix domain-containing protein n=1 Tax=Streptomyces mobaraensis TaxID=35621 RepID=A0A5N5W642_STRMB|nr:helix-turn-helix domain-containing protein [Streptomyces mobaraensis]
MATVPPPKQLDPSASLAALYGSKLRRLRRRAGLTQPKLAAKVPISHSRIAQYELGKESPSQKVNARLDEILGADGELIDMWEAIENTPFPDWLQKYFEYEAKATAMHKYLAHHIPGLLQTETYARQVMGQAQPWLSEDELKVKVQGRLDRQKLLSRPDPPLLWSVLDESVLRRPVGGPAAMRDQLLHVLEAAKAPNVEVQVLPFTSGCYSIMGGSVTVLSFSAMPDMVYFEGDFFGRMVRDRVSVARHSHRYDLVHAAALAPSASIALIEQVVEEYDACAR